MQFLRNDEVKEEDKYKYINKDLMIIEKNPNIDFDMHQFVFSSFSYIYKDISILIKNFEKCLSCLPIENMNYTYLSIYRTILLKFLDNLDNEEKVRKGLKNKKINDLDLAKEVEELKVPQNQLFIFYYLSQKKLIKKIANIDYLKYIEIFEKNDEEKEEKEDEEKEEKEEKEKKEEKESIKNSKKSEEESSEEVRTDKEEDDNDEPLRLISKSEKLYIKNKNFTGIEPFIELCLDKSNFVWNFVTLALAYPQLNEKSKNELESMLENLPNFKKQLFIFIIKLVNNCAYNGDNEDILIFERFSQFIGNKDFIEAVEKNYKKDELLKGTDPENDKIKIEKYLEIKNKLNDIYNANLECCLYDEDIIKDYLKVWYDNFEEYMRDLDDEYYSKIGRENEYKIKQKFDELIKKLKDKRTKIKVCIKFLDFYDLL